MAESASMAPGEGEIRTLHRTCNLCEAMCGVRIDVAGGRRDNDAPATILRITPDPADPLSVGALCSKAIGLKEVQEDPDRLRRPVRRTSSGWSEISWDEALDLAARRLVDIQQRDGNDAVGSYLGNPGAHNFGSVMYLTLLLSGLSSRNRYAASSLDQNPKHASSILLYGNSLSIPIPDIDHTDFLLILGANPVVSNGSLMTAPGFRRRIRALQGRGGHLVVVDPRRSETAALADTHLFIRPGADALLLASLIHVVLEENLTKGSHLAPYVDGAGELRRTLAAFAPEAVQHDLGLDPDSVRDLARAFAAAPSAVCYGRVGTCMTSFGSLNSWLIDVLSLVTGNLDRVGGALFPKPAADLAQLLELRGVPGEFGDERTRVRGAPAFNGERPTACLAEEISVEGEGQIRGMVTIAGNPCLSAPNSRAVERAFASLEFFVAIDFYINETTRHADLILPPTWSLEHDNHEILFHGFAVHNTAKYSPVVIEPDAAQLHDWQILSGLGLRISELRSRNPLQRIFYRALRSLVPSPRRVLDWMLRIGHYGDGFRPWRQGLRLADLEAAPSGIDLGPLAPRLEAMLRASKRRIDLAPERMLRELTRLREGRAQIPMTDAQLLLIGRRERRSNNSWFHNIRSTTKGAERCTLMMHPEDARARGLRAGDRVSVRSRVGEVTAILEVTQELMQGVVSLPHGWGHRGPGLRLGVASQHPGVNCNNLTDDSVLEPVVGNAVFNGVPVEVEAAH